MAPISIALEYKSVLMTTNFCNRRGINQYGGTTTENDGGETNDGIDEGREDAVTASNEKDWRVVDTHSLESLPDAEAHCTGDFFIDEFNCGNCLDIETELQNDSLCIDGFEHGGTSVISKQNVSTSEENNIDVAYEGRMAQTFFNEEKAPPPPHPEMRYIVMSISVFAILGCLARVYTDILFHDRLGATTTGNREKSICCVETFCSMWWWCSFLLRQAQAQVFLFVNL